MSNNQLQTGKDDCSRIVVGQSPYDAEDKRYNYEGYQFTRPAFIVSDKAANSNLITLTRVLDKIVGPKQAESYITNYDSQKIVTDLTTNGVYLANIKDDREKLLSLAICGNQKIKFLLFGSKAIDAFKNIKPQNNIEIYTYPHPSPRNNGIYRAIDSGKKSKYNKREYSTPKEIKKYFTIKELNVEPSVPYTENNTKTDIEWYSH